MKFIAIDSPKKEHGYISADFVFQCPGCKCHHGVWTTHKNGNQAIWQFNNDLEKPTVSPSILVTWEPHPTKGGKFICHSFVRDGNIEFLTDCTHELAGKTVELPNI